MRLLDDLREMVVEQHQYRELLLSMTTRDLLLRYKQTFMGFAWAVFTPLLNTVVFSVIFMRVAPIETGMPYPVFAYCGLLTWNFFASSLRFSVGSLTNNANLVTKVYFPREILPLSAVIVSLVDFAVASVILAGLMLYYGIGISHAVFFLPVVLLVHVAFTAGISLFLAMANLFYRDVKYLFEVVITVWMFATSVLYPIQLVGGRVGEVLKANPMSAIIDAYRAVLLRGELPDPGSFGYASLAAIVTLAVGWLVFHRAEFQFAENV
jgi:ABC-type polysaccharide/polyol phosphate export permease